MSSSTNTRGSANLMTNSSMLSAVNGRTFDNIYHLGVLVDHNTPAWGNRTQTVSIAQLPCDNHNTFNDDRIEANVGIGTHVDGLGHIDHRGTYFGGLSNDQVYRNYGIKRLGLAENVPFFMTRFRMLDMARYLRHDIVPGGYKYTVEDIRGAMNQQQVSINEGDIILLRSGWVGHLNDPATFNGSEPGPGVSAATYLADMKPVMIGGDTVALEVQEAGGWTDYPVHKFLLYERGIYIGEVFNLEKLARDRAHNGTIIIPITQTTGLAQSRVNPICFV